MFLTSFNDPREPEEFWEFTEPDLLADVWLTFEAGLEVLIK